MSKKLVFVVSVLLIFIFALTACQPAAEETPAVQPTTPPVTQPEATQPPAAQPTTPPVAEPTTPPAADAVTITLWTKEGEADGGFQWVTSLTDAYTAAHPEVVFEVVNKEVETLREDFQTSSLAGAAPDLLWTVNDHTGPFTLADLIQPVDNLIDLEPYIDGTLDAVEAEGQTWGVPISSGNHLMLLYNKDLVAEPPANTDELITKATEATDSSAGIYGLVFNQTEPFWLVPWLGGFGGKVYAEDGITPTLDTPEMVATLQFLYDLKYEHQVIPSESDYDGADALFKEGKAAMIINGDWSLGGYKEALGDKLGVAPIPQVVSTSMYPAPFTSGTYFMVPRDVPAEELDVIVDFMQFVTNEENQKAMVNELTRLPALEAALDDPAITGDPILAGSAEQMSYGTGMPANIEMRCNWDSMKPEMQAVLADSKTPEDAAAAMQPAAESCIASLQ